MMHVEDIISTVEDTILCNLSTVGDIMYMWGYNEYCGGVQYRGGTQMTKNSPPPMVLKISPHMHHDIPHGTAHTLHRVLLRQEIHRKRSEYGNGIGDTAEEHGRNAVVALSDMLRVQQSLSACISMVKLQFSIKHVTAL